MEQGNEFFLQFRAHIDQEVAATDEVELGKRRVACQIMLGKDQHVANDFMDAEAAAGFGREEPGKSFSGNIGGDFGGKQAGPGGGNGAGVNVGGEYLRIEFFFQSFLPFGEQDGDGIGFLPGGATGRPDADRGAGGLTREELWNYLFREHSKGRAIAEKVCDADEDVRKEGVQLRRRFLNKGDVGVEGFYFIYSQPALNAAVEGVWFVEREVMPAVDAEQRTDFPQRIFGL